MVAIRDAEATRLKILEVCAEEMTRHGYKAASLSEIISKAGISKGALYHHFTNKQELGYAVFEEVFAAQNLSFWRTLLVQEDPLQAFCDHIAMMPEHMSNEEMECGCPVNTISQEMSAEDEGFRERTLAMYRSMQQIFSKVLLLSQEKGLLKGNINIERCALFMVSSLQGISSLMKASRDRATVEQLTLALQDYMNGLRAD